MSVLGKECSTSGEPYRIRFRAQFGDVGPFEFQKSELSLEDLTVRAYSCWPKEDSSLVGNPTSEDDVKFIWNGRVLIDTEDLVKICEEYYSLAAKDGETCVLTLHAVLRPPKLPVKRRGKRKGDSRHRSERGSNSVDAPDCSCCVFM